MDEEYLQNTSVVENAHVILKYINSKPWSGGHCNECSSKTAKIIVKNFMTLYHRVRATIIGKLHF
jgi:hypothetical protein